MKLLQLLLIHDVILFETRDTYVFISVLVHKGLPQKLTPLALDYEGNT